MTLPPLTTGAEILFLGPNSASVTVTLQGQAGVGVNGAAMQTLTLARGTMWMVRGEPFYWSLTNIANLNWTAR